MITTASPIVGKGGSVDDVLEYVWPGDELVDVDASAYLRELKRLCDLVGFDFRILSAQAVHETGGFESYWWNQRNNPAGLGITGDPTQDAASHTWATGTDAARAHVVHMAVYVYGSRVDIDRPMAAIIEPIVKYDPRFKAVIVADLAGTVKVLGDLGNGKWATDPDYATQIAAKANRIFTDTGGTTMGLYAVAGLAKKIELPVPLVQAIIPAGQTNQRPGIKRQLPGYWVQHETANTAPGANAQMHSTWLHNGADGSQLSFHFAVDDGQIIQLIPIDEVTWQAADGAGPGNMSGVSCELCVNAGIDTAKARRNAEVLAGGVLRVLGLGVDRVKRHYDFNQADPDRHHCPDEMMSQGYWPTFVANVGKIIGGTAVAEPFAISWEPGAVGLQKIGETTALALLGEVKARRNVDLHQSANSSSPVVHTVKASEKVKIVGTCRDQKTARRWGFFEYADGKYGRALLSAFEPQFPSL